jgi:regulator of cell morphogenesis and NO signaling
MGCGLLLWRQKTLAEACKEAGVDVEAVQQDLQQLPSTSYLPVHAYAEWSIDFLANYIYNIHHSYVRKKCC